MTTFEERFNELLKQVGRPYEMFNSDGTCQGCLYPLQVIYPHIPRYNLPYENPEKNYIYCIERLNKFFNKICRNELKKGDVIASVYKDEAHIAIYWEYDKIIHVFRNHELFISKLDMLKFAMTYWRIKV